MIPVSPRVSWLRWPPHCTAWQWILAGRARHPIRLGVAASPHCRASCTAWCCTRTGPSLRASTSAPGAPHTLRRTLYTLHCTPYTPHPTPHALHCIPCTVHLRNPPPSTVPLYALQPRNPEPHRGNSQQALGVRSRKAAPEAAERVCCVRSTGRSMTGSTETFYDSTEVARRIPGYDSTPNPLFRISVPLFGISVPVTCTTSSTDGSIFARSVLRPYGLLIAQQLCCSSTFLLAVLAVRRLLSSGSCCWGLAPFAPA